MNRAIALSGAAVLVLATAVTGTWVALAQSAPTSGSSTQSPLAYGPGQPRIESRTLEDALQAERKTGWTRVGTGDLGIEGYVRTSELSPDGPDAPQAGEQLTVFDSEMREIGYWIVPLGFVRAEIVDAPGFDWKAELRRVNPDGADEILQQYGELP